MKRIGPSCRETTPGGSPTIRAVSFHKTRERAVKGCDARNFDSTGQ